MSYDAEIRIKTKIDSEPVKELGKDIDSVSKRAQNAKDRMDSLDKAGVPHTAAAYREAAADLKKWSAELEGIQNAQKGASDSMNYFRRETERYKAVLKDLESNGKYFGDEEYDQAYASLKRLESMLGVYKKNVVSSTDSTNRFKREISQITGELASLEREGYYFGDNEYDEVYRSLQNALNAQKEYKAQLDRSTESGMAEAAERAAKAKEREETAQRRLQEQAERNLQRENARLQKQVEAENKIQAQAAEEQRLAAIKSSAVVTDEKIVAALERKKQLTAEIKELEKAGLGQGYSEWDSKQRELASVNAELKNHTNSLLGADNKQRSLSGSLGGLIGGLKKVGNAGKKAFLGIGNNAKKTNGHIKKSNGLLQTFASRLKGIALSLLIFNWITKAFNFVVEGIKEGFKNLVQYSDSYNKSVSELMSANTQLKNSFATAFQPLIEMVIPYLVQFVKFLTEAVNKVAQLTAALTGKETWTRAKAVQQDYAKSLDKTAESAEKAAGQLAAFDKLDVLQPKKEDKEDDGLKPEDMFEEVPVDDYYKGLAKKLKGLLDKAKQLLADFFAPIKAAWDKYGKLVIDAWKKALANIWQLVKDIGKSFMEVWTNGTGERFIGNILQLMALLGYTVAALAGWFDAAWVEAGRGTRVIQSIFDLLNAIMELVLLIGYDFLYVFEVGGYGKQIFADLLDIIANIFETATNLVVAFSSAWQEGEKGKELFTIIGEILVRITGFLRECSESLRDWSSSVNFNGLISGFNRLLASTLPIIDTISDGLLWLLEKVLLPLAAYTINDLIPAFFELLAAALEAFGSILTAVLPVILDFVEYFLLPIAKWTGGVAISIIKGLTSALTKFSDWASQNKQAVQNMATVILGFLAGLYAYIVVQKLPDLLEGLYVKFLRLGEAFTAANAQALGAKITFGLLAAAILLIAQNFDKMNNLERVIAILGAISIAAAGAAIAMGALQSALTMGIAAAAIVAGVAAIAASVSSAQKRANSSLSGLNKTQKRYANNFNIPQLAEGAVIRGGNPFMAILGDQPAGHTNIETPLSTMIEAFNQSLDSRGGFGNEVQNINLSIRYEGDLAGLARVLKPVIEAENNRIGVSMITNVGGV